MSDTTDQDDEEVENSSAPLIEHLAELRTRLIRSVIAFIIGIVLAFTMAEPILQFLLAPIEETLRQLVDPAPTMEYTSPQEYRFTLFRISMVLGSFFFMCWRCASSPFTYLTTLATLVSQPSVFPRTSPRLT